MHLTQYTIERKFDAPPARLYEAFTQPELLEEWIWGDYAKAVKCELDVRINGVVSVSLDEGQGMRSAMRGIYLEIDPGRRLIHTVHWDASVGYNEGGKALDEVLVVDFLPDGDGSMLRYLHMGIPDDGQSAKTHEQSVRTTLNFLEKVVTR